MLQVADKDLLLLSLSHLAKLPELILLENSESLEIRDPLLSNLVVVDALIPLVSSMGVKVLPPHNVYKLIILRLLLRPIFSPG